MPFVKGQSGNPDKKFSKENQPEKNGRPKKLPELDKLLADCFGDNEMEQILKALHKQALSGNVRASEIILDRAYGKAKQTIESDINIKDETELIIKGKKFAGE